MGLGPRPAMNAEARPSSGLRLGGPAGVRNSNVLAAGGDDLRGSRPAEPGRVNLQRLGQRAAAQDLDPVEIVALDEPLGSQGGLVDDRARVEIRVDVAQVDDRVFLLEGPLKKPRLGTRRARGIWPPSKIGLSLNPWREAWPLCPLDEVLPWPDPIPRPTRFRSLRRWTPWWTSCNCIRERLPEGEQSLPSYAVESRRRSRP